MSAVDADVVYFREINIESPNFKMLTHRSMNIYILNKKILYQFKKKMRISSEIYLKCETKRKHCDENFTKTIESLSNSEYAI